MHSLNEMHNTYFSSDFAANYKIVPVFEDFPLDFAQLDCPIQI